MNFSKRAFGKYIKQKRTEKGISREELAKEMHVSYEALTKWENGERIPDFPTIGILASQLGVSVQEIYDNSTVEKDVADRVITTICLFLLLAALLSGIIVGFLRIGKKSADDSLPMSQPSEDQHETDDTMVGKNIRVYHGFPTKESDSRLEEYINQYLENQGCDFHIELVGNDSGLAYDEYLAREKTAGMTIDIEVSSLTSYEARRDFAQRAEAGEYYAIDTMLESEMGRKLINGLSQYMASEGDKKKTLAYLESYRMKDGHMYGVPSYANFSAPYFLCYDRALLEKYGVEELTGDITDLDKILAKSEEMRRDMITPISIDYDGEWLFGSLFGFEAYDDFWLLKPNADGKPEAVNIFENTELMSWYQRLGDLRQQENVGLPIKYSKEGDGTEQAQGRSAVILFPGETDSIGKIISMGDQLSYDVLRVETSFPLRGMICINNQTLYPEACFQFIEMLYDDTEFRRLLNLGPEGVGYEVKEENGKNILHEYHNAKGLPFALGMGADYRIYQKYDNEDYRMYQEKLYEGNAYAHKSILGLANEVDFSAVMTEYEACNQIFRNHTQVFFGSYGDATKKELDTLYKRLIEAGYVTVLEEINRQLGGID